VRRRRRFDLEWLKLRWPTLLLAALLSLAAAALVVRTSVIYWLGSRADVAAAFAPNNPRVLAAAIDRELTAHRGTPSDRTVALASRALHHAPMLDDPLLVGGIRALQLKDEGKARQLLQHALARNPRSEFTRLLRLELDLRSGDVRRAVFDMTILGRLLPDVQTIFVPELARLARDPRTTQALAPTLRTDPRMLAAVLHYMADNGASPALVLKLAGRIPIGPPPEDRDDWREPLLKAMVAKGDAQDARKLWAAFAGMKEASTEGGAIYDDAFRGLPGLPPFNWALNASEIGAAERNKNGGLEVEYYGREPGELAAQLIALAPGRYRMAFRVEGEIQDPQHRLFWRVYCARPDNVMLVEVPIANVTFAGKTLGGDFSVPTDCPAQWLKLVGEPTEFPKIESVTVRRIQIVSSGGA
jgi:hypothetical protein